MFMKLHVRTALLLFPLILSPLYLLEDDGAASIAAGGIVVMKREPRIVMAKEVAFPVPDYAIDYQQELPRPRFDDFHLWIEGTPAAFQTETRAFVRDKDYTDLLTSLQVEIATFGHAGRSLDDYPDIHKLTAPQHNQLGELALIDAKDDQPLWYVRKKYYWQQTFPAHATVHIRHEYTPVLGANNGFRYAFNSSPDKLTTDELKSFCLDGPMRSKLDKVRAQSAPPELWRGWVFRN